MDSLADNNAVLSEQEAAVYDRQIRIWGVEAQKRLSKARLLVVYMTGVVAEALKNVVLAGVGSITLMDDRLVSEDTSQSNFLLPAGGLNDDRGKTYAEVCGEALRDFNPMVEVAVAQGPISGKGASFFKDFDVVLLGRVPRKLQEDINALCRESGTGLYTVDCRGTCGVIFVDLIRHVFVSQKKGEEKGPSQEMSFVSLKEALSEPWWKYGRKCHPLLLAHQVVMEYEMRRWSCGQVDIKQRQPSTSPSVGHGGREGTDTGKEDGDGAAAAGTAVEGGGARQGMLRLLREELGPEQLMMMQAGNDSSAAASASSLPALLSAAEALLRRMSDEAAAEGVELPPVAAIVGGILGQEIVKGISGKGEPINNFFLYDASEDGKGVIERVGSIGSGNL